MYTRKHDDSTTTSLETTSFDSVLNSISESSNPGKGIAAKPSITRASKGKRISTTKKVSVKLKAGKKTATPTRPTAAHTRAIKEGMGLGEETNTTQEDQEIDIRDEKKVEKTETDLEKEKEREGGGEEEGEDKDSSEDKDEQVTGILTGSKDLQEGTQLAKRKRKDGSDGEDETTRSIAVVKTGDSTIRGNYEANKEAPKLQPNLRSPEAVKKKRKMSSAAGKKQKEKVSVTQPVPPTRKMSIAEDTRREILTDFTVGFMDTGDNSERFSGKDHESGEEGYIDLDVEEEEEEEEKPKSAIKKITELATPKKSPKPRAKRATTKKAIKEPPQDALETDNEKPTTPTKGSASKSAGILKVPRGLSSAMKKSEMELIFDTASERLDWAGIASILNSKSSGKTHLAGNLKKHWVVVLKKRVLDGYAD